MLMLACEGAFERLPPNHLSHWGGVLHGFVEGSAIHYAPHLLSLIRPQGMDEFSSIAIEAPPFGQTAGTTLSFGVVLFRDATQAWAPFVRALMQQTAHRLHGNKWSLNTIMIVQPGSPTLQVVQQGRLVDPLPQPESPDAWCRRAAEPPTLIGAAAYTLALRTPLLCGSRGRVRRENICPWPNLRTLLESLVRRACTLEPALAALLDLDASIAQSWPDAPPMVSAATPAQQVHWLYNAQRGIVKPGIVGAITYFADLPPAAQTLLHWGQWLGIGQQTSMGCGRYVLQSSIPPSATPLT